MGSQTREVPLVADEAALLIIDMQRYCAVMGEGLFKDVNPQQLGEHEYFAERLKNTTIPAIQSLLKAARPKIPKIEVIYTYIESLTKDGRDQSLDYKLSNFLVPKDSPDAKIIDELTPVENDILIPKTSCSVFNSTNIEYVLRNLGVKQLVVTGIVTNQCVESAVRDAADRGFLVTLVEDACATHAQSDHDQSLKNMRGFSRICRSADVAQEINQL